MISVENLTVEFSARPLFHDVSFVVNDHDRIALVGKNGAGKSTLLKILCGLQRPTSGAVNVPAGETIGYLPQVMKLSDDTTVREETRKAFAGHTEMKARLDRMQREMAQRTDYESESYLELIDSFTQAQEWAMMSYLARVSYNYDSRYLLTANFRADGSSKLAPGKRWGYFPSVSAGWRISQEEFLKDVDWLSELKLRGGWGQTGNQAGISSYAYLQRYSITRQNWWESGKGDAMITLAPNSFSNPNLTWETTTQTNFGIDLGLFQNRLNLAVDAYLKKTTDLLLEVDLPATSPIRKIYRNEGEMTNKGLEVNIDSRNLTGEFTWNTNFNISFNKNELTKLTLQKIYDGALINNVTSENVVRLTEGQPLGKFWGLISDGVDPQTGDIKYRDLNGDGKINSSDKTYIGDPNPDFTFGFTNDFSYKNFTLSVFFQGSYGNDIYNASRIETEGMYDGKNQSIDVLNRWRKAGDVTDIPRAVRGTDNIKASSRWVEDGSYVRLKTLTLAYSVPTDALQKYGIHKVQPYFTAQNLWTLTSYKGFDPEVNENLSGSFLGIDYGTYPQTKTFIFGLNIEF